MNRGQKKCSNRCVAFLLVGILFLNLFSGTFIVHGESIAEGQVSQNQLEAFAAEEIANGLWADFVVDGQWDGGYNGRLVLRNVSDKPVRNWKISFSCKDELYNFYHATLASHEEDIYIIQNNGYNRDIQPGASVELGFGGSYSGEISKPENFKFLSAVTEVEEGAQISFALSSQWQDGCCCEVTIQNQGSRPIEDWRLFFLLDAKITNLWNAAIISMENGRYTVRSCDYNSVIPAGEAVTFGFQISGKWDDVMPPAQFKLEQNAAGTEPELIYETTAQADYAALHIGYQENDCQYAVTKDVALETKGEYGSDITWSSSNGAVIETNGHVSRPAESTYVTLTASIDDGMEKLEKQFVVKVIRQELQGAPELLDYQDIVEMNDPETLKMYAEEDGETVSYISGKYSNQKIETFKDAENAVRGIGMLLGLQEDDSFVAYIRNTDEIHSTYRFKQFYKGIEVLDHGLIVGTDGAGNTTHLLSYYQKNLDMGIEPAIGREQADAGLAGRYGGCEIRQNELVIAENGERYVLAWHSFVELEGDVLDVLMDAETGAILRETSCSMEDQAVQISAASGSIAAEGTYTKRLWETKGTYYTANLPRKLFVCDAAQMVGDDLNTAPFVKSDTNKFDDELAVYALYHLELAYDYYKDFMGRESMDGRCSAVMAYVHYSKKEDQEENKEYENAFCRGEERIICFGDGKNGGFVKGLDVVAHEYTHGVVYYKAGYTNTIYFRTLGEAYADIMGGIVEAQMGGDAEWWIHGEDHADFPGLGSRNLKDPAVTGNPSVYKGNNWVSETDPSDDDDHSKFRHTNSMVVSHAAYLMQQSTIPDLNKLGKLWYYSMDYLKYSNKDFMAIRESVVSAAETLGYSRAEIAGIEKAFDDVGIRDGRVTYEPCNYVITGRVVEADEDTKISNNKALTGYSIIILGKQTYYSEGKNGAFRIGLQRARDYQIIIKKDGYEDQSFTIKIEEGKLNYQLGTIELLPNGAAGDGYAEGRIIDASTGEGVEGLTLTFRKGRYAKTDRNMTEKTTGKDGAYVTDELAAGIYCVEVLDERTDIAEDERYPKQYFHIKVLGNRTIRGQNGYIIMPGGKEHYNGHTYQLFQARMLWKDAEEYCESIGGHLVTIRDEEENKFVGNMVGSAGVTYAAIGFTDEEEEGEWKWVTGEKDTYTNWNRGEPNNGLRAYLYQNHGYIYGKQPTWDDGVDYVAYPFVCEWDGEVEDEDQMDN